MELAGVLVAFVFAYGWGFKDGAVSEQKHKARVAELATQGTANLHGREFKSRP